MIAQDSIREVQERAQIVDVISDEVSLKRQGRGLVGLCPFHAERSPSFHVNASEGFYHCFGCGASGNAISFVMQSKGLSFPEAIRYLAERFGITLKEDSGGTQTPKQDFSKELVLANKLAAEFFAAHLKRAPPPVREYLVERGLDEQTIKNFTIGFAGKDRNALNHFLREKGISDQRQLQAGLVRRNERGEIYDTFRSRLVFPIAVDTRKIVAFGGRIIPSICDPKTLERSPKYLNSPESPIYEKRKTLFGLPQAIPSMREHGHVYLVEGYMDVVSLSKVGVGEVVATCGTALTEEHLRRLSRLTKRVILLFDGDSAGRQAAGRTFEIGVNAEIDIFALFLPVKDDPDTIARTHGQNTRAYLESLEKTPLLDCFLSMKTTEYGVDRLSELGPASIEKITQEVIKVLKKVSRPLLRERLVEEAAFRLRIKPDTLRGVTSTESPEKNSSSQNSGEETSESQRASVAVSSLSPVDRDIIRSVMTLREEACGVVVHDPVVCEILHPETLRFVEAIREICVNLGLDDQQRRVQVKGLLAAFGKSWTEYWRESYEITQVPGTDMKKLFKECIERIHNDLWPRRQYRKFEDELRKTETQEEKLLIHEKMLQLQRRMKGVGKRV
jgi:DNA primase